jgi:hypothetical protein
VQNLRGIHRDFGAGRATTGPFCIASKTSLRNTKKEKGRRKLHVILSNMVTEIFIELEFVKTLSQLNSLSC